MNVNIIQYCLTCIELCEGMCKSQPSKRWSEESHLRRETSPEEVEVRSAGSRMRYECGLARRFYNLELSSNGTYQERMMQCNWNRSWTPESSLDPCVWVQCINPPPPPGGSGMRFVWDGSPVEFGQNVSYVCEEEGLYFEAGREISEFNVTCLTDGSWKDVVWPRCISSVNCTDPPARPASGEGLTVIHVSLITFWLLLTLDYLRPRLACWWRFINWRVYHSGDITSRNTVSRYSAGR